MGLLWGQQAWAAPCGTWNAGVTVSTTSGAESQSLTVSWNAAPAACTNPFYDNWDSVDHYALYRRDGAVYSTSSSCTDNTTSFSSSGPTGADLLNGTVSSGATTYQDDMYRSAKDFRYHIVACEDASCTRKYGDAPGELVTYKEDYDCTERESWTIWDVDTLTVSSWDPGVDWVVEEANASAALFYPADFEDGSSNDIEGMLGLWWSEGCNGHTDCVYYMRADDTGPQHFNEYSSWTDVTGPVAEETDGNSGDFTLLSHPWVVAWDDGDQGIELWMRRSNGTHHNHTVEMESADEQGADFGLECTAGSTCQADGEDCQIGDMCDYEDDSADGYGLGEIAICATGSDACFNLHGARHGRIMWDYLSNGPVDFSTDEPWMVFSGNTDNSDCTNPGSTSQPEIYRAEWDSTGGEWVVVDDGGSPHACPVVQGSNDRHDPGVVPLPDGSFKMYYKEGMDTPYVVYWDPVGAEWEDEAEIQVFLDDGGTTDVSFCVENMDVVKYDDDWASPNLMFFKADSDTQTSGCFDDSSGILSAYQDN